jgi:hypothetical protein
VHGLRPLSQFSDRPPSLDLGCASHTLILYPRTPRISQKKNDIIDTRAVPRVRRTIQDPIPTARATVAQIPNTLFASDWSRTKSTGPNRRYGNDCQIMRHPIHVLGTKVKTLSIGHSYPIFGKLPSLPPTLAGAGVGTLQGNERSIVFPPPVHIALLTSFITISRRSISSPNNSPASSTRRVAGSFVWPREQ